MVKPTLLVLAAGMGSRYGSLKQMDGVGPNNEAIIDYSIYDAIRAISRPVVEVHISNPLARPEEIRHRSLIAPACRGTIAGFGIDSYRLAIESFI